MWGWLSYDPELNLIYHGTSNPGPWNGNQRPGDNKWSAAIIARDADTGEMVWAFQPTPHDIWDYDAVNENILVDLPIGGTTRKVLVHFDRNGFAYTIDRATGRGAASRKPFVPMNWSSGVDLATGPAERERRQGDRAGKEREGHLPELEGGKNQQPAAFSPKTGLFYVPTNNLCMDFEGREVTYIAGTPYIGGNAPENGGPGGYKGEFIAWDAAQGKKVWGIKEPFPVWSGALATAGNVVFYGTLDGWFKAVDARERHGALWKFKVGSGVVGASDDVHRAGRQAVRRGLFRDRRRYGFAHRGRRGGEPAVRRSRARHDVARSRAIHFVGWDVVRVLSVSLVFLV